MRSRKSGPRASLAEVLLPALESSSRSTCTGAEVSLRPTPPCLMRSEVWPAEIATPTRTRCRPGRLSGAGTSRLRSSVVPAPSVWPGSTRVSATPTLPRGCLGPEPPRGDPSLHPLPGSSPPPPRCLSLVPAFPVPFRVREIGEGFWGTAPSLSDSARAWAVKVSSRVHGPHRDGCPVHSAAALSDPGDRRGEHVPRVTPPA